MIPITGFGLPEATPDPVILYVSPTTVPHGVQFVATGQNFATSGRLPTTADIDGTSVTLGAVTDETIVATAPTFGSYPHTGTLTVNFDDGTSATAPITVSATQRAEVQTAAGLGVPRLRRRAGKVTASSGTGTPAMRRGAGKFVAASGIGTAALVAVVIHAVTIAAAGTGAPAFGPKAIGVAMQPAGTGAPLRGTGTPRLAKMHPRAIAASGLGYPFIFANVPPEEGTIFTLGRGTPAVQKKVGKLVSVSATGAPAVLRALAKGMPVSGLGTPGMARTPNIATFTQYAMGLHSGPQGFWMLDDSVVSAPTVHDQSGNAHDGGDVGSPSRQQASLFGNGAFKSTFYTGGASVRVPNHTDFRLTTSGTLIAFTNITISGNVNSVFGKLIYNGGFTDGYHLYWANGMVNFVTYNGSVSHTYTDGGTYSDGNNHMICAAWDGTGVSIYLDDTRIFTTGTFTPPGDTPNGSAQGDGTANLMIGRDLDPNVLGDTNIVGYVQAGLVYKGFRASDADVATLWAKSQT